METAPQKGSKDPGAEGLRLERKGDVLWVWLDREPKRNSFDEPMMRGLVDVFTHPGDDVRALVLSGRGSVFCAGADLGWMAAHPDREGSGLVAQVFAAVRHCPRPVVGRINGPAIGGGVGLTACCDVAVCVPTTFFQLAEVRVGIVPAVISPYVNEKIGPGRLREWILTAERIDASRAADWGLVSRVAADNDGVSLDAEVDRVLELILAGSVPAQKVGKDLVAMLSGLTDSGLGDRLIDIITELRRSNEAQARMKAFLNKGPAGKGGSR